MRVVFINLHGNEMLVKTMNKFVFKQSVAIKHKYFLDYLLSNKEVEVCSYVNPHGFSMASNLSSAMMKILNLFRFAEHRLVLKKNGIPLKSVTLIKKVEDIKKDDLVLIYRHSSGQLYEADAIHAFKAISMIHFSGSKSESEEMSRLHPDVLFNESNLSEYSKIFKTFYPWYEGPFIIHPFVAASRFQRRISFSERENKAFATGTITYKDTPEFLEVYGDACDQPSRKQIKDNENSLADLLVCTSKDFSEGTKTIKTTMKDGGLKRLYNSLHYKLFESQQKSYYSFDMVQSFNKYKMCIVGEEILGVPGIGFVEGMACGCAYIGQRTGYYEDYGMKEGVHYIGYDGTLDDLKDKIRYYQRPEHQEELEKIANAGYEFAEANFRGEAAAKTLLEKLVKAQKEWMKTNR